MRILGKVSFCVAVGLLFMAPHATAALGVSLDVLWKPNPEDGRQVALHVTNMAYPMPREEVIEIFHRIPNQYDDYPVLAFICHHSHVDPVTVWEYKTKGHKWSNVMAHFGVSPGLLFIDLPRAPGPPYGKAYGYWRKQGNGISQDNISNEDIRFWVNLRTVSAYAAVQPARVMEWRDSGKQFNQVSQAKYREKHGKGPKMQEAGFGGPGNSPGKSQGNGKAKGHDKEKHDN